VAVTAGGYADVSALLLEAPGETVLRIAAEAVLAAGGGVIAETPASANALVLCGEMPERYDDLVERLWQQMPYPKTRVELSAVSTVSAAVDAGARRIRDLPAQRAAALREPVPVVAAMPAHDMSGMSGHDMSGMSGHDMSSMSGGADEHAGHDMSGMSGADEHAGHDMSSMSGHDMSSMSGGAGEHAGHDMSGMSGAGEHAGHDMSSMSGHDMSGMSGHDMSSMSGGAGEHAGHDMSSMSGHDMSSMSGGADEHAGHDMSSMSGHDMSSMSGGADEHAGHDMSSMSGHDMSSMSGHDMSSMSGHDMSGMSGHDHMNMAGPGGYPLAMGDDDRDGLEMDVLNRTLGPFLPEWDPRLLLHVVLAGDTVRSATVEIVAAPAVDPAAPVLRLDLAVRMLRLAGWPAVADRAARARDAAAAGESERARHDAVSARRSVARSIVLRWALRGLAVDGIPLRDVLLGALDDAARMLGGETPRTAPIVRTAAEIVELVTGRDLGTARLLVAAVHPDPADTGAPEPEPMDHSAMGHGDAAPAAEHSGMDHSGMNHGGMNHGGMNHGGMNHG